MQTFDGDLHSPIIYPAAIIVSSKDKETVQKLLEYLQTDTSKAIYEKYGFIVKE
ncbi:molybdate ABC transporter substrate-binding protein [Gottschalkia acidurici]|uniref:molybdate ABC transporter substrate-binding protein n=1 Tax=Clostridium acidurici TaxID=1556 RepID=UPI003B82C849